MFPLFCLDSFYQLPLQARATLGLFPSVLPLAVLAELGWHPHCDLRQEVAEEEGRFPLLLCKKDWQSPKVRFSHQVETIPSSQISPRAPLCSDAIA